MSGNGAERTTTKASPMNIDGKLNHIIGGNPLSLIFRMRQAGIWQIERTVQFFLAHRWIRGIDYYYLVSDGLCDTCSRIFIGLFFNVPEIARVFLLIRQAFFV